MAKRFYARYYDAGEWRIYDRAWESKWHGKVARAPIANGLFSREMARVCATALNAHYEKKAST